jgi:deazaflavin-dependent oxidoreductase (nitroreductase family)
VNPLQRVARNPTAYRWLVLRGRVIAEALESLLRFATSGRVGVLDLAGLPNVQITTAGRKTGLARTATVQYEPDGDGLVLVGSNWGRERHPSWSANLIATERVIVRRRGRRLVEGTVAHRGGTGQGVGHCLGELAELSDRPRSRRRASVQTVPSDADQMMCVLVRRSSRRVLS